MHRERPAYRKVRGPFSALLPQSPADAAPLPLLTAACPQPPTEPRPVPLEPAVTIVYQPIIDLATRQLAGHEALARFAEEPLRPPDQWFNEAAALGLQERLELAVIRKALKGLAHFPARTYVSLNVSPQTILTGAIEAVLDGWPLERLMLEVTEHASVSDYPRLAAKIEPLRRKGLRLAVDDAGAGFASFRHILELKPDVIKLDISLIREIDLDSRRRALAAALIRFARETGSKILAEGVERDAELAVLRELRVSKAQGYLLGRPMPIGSVDGSSDDIHCLTRS